MAGIEIDTVHLGAVGRTHQGLQQPRRRRGPGKNREVTREDVRRVIDAARAVALPSDREILHVLPQEFIVDDQDGIGDPVGMTGTRLEVNVHIITGGASSTQNLVACVNRAGVEVADTVLEQLAAAEAVLTPDERELGVALVDIGGGTTDIAIFERGACGTPASSRSAASTSPTTSPSACARRCPTRRSVKQRYGCALVGAGRRGRDDGGAERRRAQAAPPRAAHPRRHHRAARRGDLPSALGRDPARRLREVAATRASCSPAAARCSRAWPRSPSRSSTCRCGAAARPASAGSPMTSRARRTPPPSGSCCTAPEPAGGPARRSAAVPSRAWRDGFATLFKEFF